MNGIYQIINLTNEKLYIGSSKNIEKRWYQHKKDLISNRHKNKYLQNDFNKCGIESFEFKIIANFEASKEITLEIEQFYLSWFFDDQQKCYNIQKLVAPNPKTYSKNPEETKRKLREASKRRLPISEETRRLKSIAQTGKKYSEESKQKMRLAKLGRKQTPEAIENNRKANTGKKRPRKDK